MLNKLDEKNLKIVEIVKKTVEKGDVRAFIVGGVVRDLILGNKIKDIDFLIEGNAIEFVKNAGFKVKSVHEPFCTIKAEIEGQEIDFASTRVETYPRQGCLPLVQKTGVKIEEDLKRRDFTVNSIAINILTGDVIDPFFGKEDIGRKNLKILHENSFKDDPTRILRGLDFKYRFDFSFEKETADLIVKTAANYDNSALSIDRIYLTLNKIFKNASADKILKEILENEIYKIWLKKTSLQASEVQRLNNSAEIFSIKEKNELFIMALESCPFVKAPLNDNYEIYEFFKKFNKNQLALYYFKTKDENARRYLDLSEIKPYITGKDLLSLGFKQGKTVGEALSKLTQAKLLSPEKFPDKKSEINFIKKM